MPIILQICVEGNTGSTGRLAESIGKKTISHGWESYIAHGRFSRPSQSRIIKIGTNYDVFIHGLQTRFFDRHGLASKRATTKLISRIKEINPDIIHLHHLHGYYINIKILFEFLGKRDTPVIWTFHDCWSFTGHCVHFDFVGCEKWQTECYNCPQKNEYPASLFIDRSRKNFYLKKALFISIKNMTIVPVSGWLSDVVSRSFMGKIPRVVINNGIDLRIFNEDKDTESLRQKYSLDSKFVILGVANPWTRKKGFYDFIELSTMLNDDMVIIMVGLNKSQLKNLPANIIGITRTENQQELKKLYSISDIFLNLSVEETFGLTTVESLACGTPAIVFNATACPETVDENTGFVIEKGNIKGVLDSIISVKKTGKEKFSKACRDRANKFYNIDDRLADYYNLYKEIFTSSTINKRI